MPRGRLRVVLTAGLVASIAGLSVGCGGDEVKPPEVKPVAPSDLVKPGEEPKALRKPNPGGSGGMNYNPAGPPPGQGPP